MKTSKPISTISYNTRAFLLGKLQELERNYTISAWFFIYHFAEEDEAKDHFHVFIKPNGKIDTCELQAQFKEYCSSDPNIKPLGCIDFQASKIDDAYLYFAHYKPYLSWKHQKRRYHYDWSCFACSDFDWLEYVHNHALSASDFAERSAILNAIQDNSNSLSNLISNGVVPLNMATSVFAYRNLLDGDLDRGGRVTHTPKDYGEEGIFVTPDGKIGGGGVNLDRSDF